MYPRWLGYANVFIALSFVPDLLLGFFTSGPFACQGLLAFWIPAVTYGIWLNRMAPSSTDRSPPTARATGDPEGATPTATRRHRSVGLWPTYTCPVSSKDITDELVHQVADELRARYGLDDEDVRTLGARLAEPPEARAAKNLEFAERFTAEHRETFDRLAQ